MEKNLIEINDETKKVIEEKGLDINNPQEILDNIIEETQKNYLSSELGKAVASALDIGIRNIFPNFIENQIINLKDNIINYGIKEGLGQSINDSINFGKSAIGLLTNNFDSIEQAQVAISKGGTIDKISDLLDESIDSLKNSKKIDASSAKKLKSEKNEILKNIEKNIENSFSNQFENMEKLEKYISNWKEYFNAQNFSKMQSEYNKMVKIMDLLMPIENTISDFRTIENLQTLIKNNGKSFDLSEEEINLANKLIN